MKYTVSVAAVLLLGILGCSTSKIAYCGKVPLFPAEEAGRYDVLSVVEDASNPAQEANKLVETTMANEASILPPDQSPKSKKRSGIDDVNRYVCLQAMRELNQSQSQPTTAVLPLIRALKRFDLWFVEPDKRKILKFVVSNELLSLKDQVGQKEEINVLTRFRDWISTQNEEITYSSLTKAFSASERTVVVTLITGGDEEAVKGLVEEMRRLFHEPPLAVLHGRRQLSEWLRAEFPRVHPAFDLKSTHTYRELRKAARQFFGFPHTEIERASVTFIKRIGRRAAPSLSQVLIEGNVPEREYAAALAGQLGPDGKDVIPQLVVALTDTDADVRAYAAESLGRIGIPDVDAVAALKKLSGIVHDRWLAYVASEALSALGERNLGKPATNE